MIATHVHHALAQIRELKMQVLSAQHFMGYSGRCRAVCGTAALAAPFVLSANGYPQTEVAHLLGWGVVLAFALVANYAAVLYWFFFFPDVKRDLRRLMPTVDALPSLLVGAILSIALIARAQYDALFGTWMCLFGLTNLSSRHVLPNALWPLGFFYIGCGTACLLVPSVSFTNPWLMGIVFGLGEWAGGFIFHVHRLPEARLSTFFFPEGERHEQ